LAAFAPGGVADTLLLFLGLGLFLLFGVLVVEWRLEE